MNRKDDDAILVLRTGRLGDFLVAFPAFAALRLRYPGRRLILVSAVSANPSTLGRAATYAHVESPPWLAWVSPRWFDEIIHVANLRSATEWLETRKRLKRFNIRKTYVLRFHDEPRRSLFKKWLWLKSLGIRGSIELGAQPAQCLSTPTTDLLSLQMRAPLSAVCAGADSTVLSRLLRSDWQMHVEASSAFWATQILAGCARPRVAVFPAATHEHKRWPLERFAATLTHLVERHGISVVFIGAEQDKVVCVELNNALGGAHMNLAGQTSLPQLAAVLANCDLFLGNDGGPAHLAATVGTRLVTIMSGVHAKNVWDPGGGWGCSVRFEGIECAGCRAEFACPLLHRRCIMDIHVARVIAACERVLTTPQASTS